MAQCLIPDYTIHGTVFDSRVQHMIHGAVFDLRVQHMIHKAVFDSSIHDSQGIV